MQAQYIRGISDSNIRVKLLEMDSVTTFEQTVNKATHRVRVARKQNTEEFNVQNREILSATFINRVSRSSSNNRASRAKNCNNQQPNKTDRRIVRVPVYAEEII